MPVPLFCFPPALVIKRKRDLTYVVVECEMRKEERDVVLKMISVDECDMERFGTLNP